ncbi:MAG TPA: hypothetical protein VFR97_05860 [Capillimicrobium sp.]|nr:hypothetical protein [Capillimicrobium sp.]
MADSTGSGVCTLVVRPSAKLPGGAKASVPAVGAPFVGTQLIGVKVSSPAIARPSRTNATGSPALVVPA